MDLLLVRLFHWRRNGHGESAHGNLSVLLLLLLPPPFGVDGLFSHDQINAAHSELNKKRMTSLMIGR